MTTKRSSNRCLLALGLAVLALRPVVTVAAGSSDLPEGVHGGRHTNHFTRAPYVQLATHQSIAVAWRTDGPIQPVVRYGRTAQALDLQSVEAATVTRVALSTNKAEARALADKVPGLMQLPRLHSAPVGYFQYEVTLSGLTPDTKYYYAVYDGSRRLTEADESYHFVTHPVPGTPRPMRFWVVGDSGTGRETQHNVHGAMLNFVVDSKRDVDFYLHVGDMAYMRGKDAEFQTRFFEAYEPTLRHVVCWASMGNHEGATSKGTNGTGPYYDAYVLPARGEAGGLASGTEAYYSFDYGRAHFICLDSHDLDRRPTGMMARWLKMDLERTRQDWIIAYFHHPPYTKGTHDSDREKQLIEMRTHIMPILESGGVDLVLTGHSHIYERSMLIDGAYATPTVSENVVFEDREGNPDTDGPYRKSAGINPNNGEIQVVAGHGGTTIGRKGTIPFMRKIIVEHGSVVVDIDGDTLIGTMINKYGEVKDRFGLVKRGTVVHERIAMPWQHPVPYKPARGAGEDPPAEAPEDFFVAIPRFAEWQYLFGSHPEGHKWTELKFATDSWKTGEAPFGFEYKEARTVLEEMRGKHTTLYLRHVFEIEQADSLAEVGLMINYDDAFIAYLNGKEVVRKGVGKGSGKDAQQIKPHDASRYGYFPLKDFEKHVKEGRNVLAIEAHNSGLDSNDFLVDPYLVLED